MATDNDETLSATSDTFDGGEDLEVKDTTYDEKDFPLVFGAASSNITSKARNEHELGSGPMPLVPTTDPYQTDDDWTIPIRSRGPVPSPTSAKQSKKIKKTQP